MDAPDVCYARSGDVSLACVVFVLGYLPYLRGMDPLSLLRPYQMGHYQGGLMMVLSMAFPFYLPSPSFL